MFHHVHATRLRAALAALLLASLACGLPSLPGGDGGGDQTTVAEATGLVLNGATLDGVTSTSEGMPAGLILSVQVTNPTTNEVIVTIPCGLVFEPPPGSDEQPLMVIQQVVETIPPGQTAELEPYLVCIDSGAAVPENGTTYKVGSLAGGNLQAFAECLCGQQLDASALGFQEMFSIQFAIWMVADGIDPRTAAEQFEGFAGEDLYQLLGPMMEMLAGPAQEWLDRCDIEIQP